MGEQHKERKTDKMRERAKKDEKYKKRMTIVWAFAITVWVGVAFFVAQVIVFTIEQ